MKSRYIVLTLAFLTVLTFAFIFDNVFSIWEQASYARFRPVTTGLPSAQIERDVKIGEVTADFFFAPPGQAKRPLLIVMHGGFLQGGNKKNYAYLGGLGVRQGYTVAILQLKHYPGIFTRPFFSSDARRARSLPEQAKNFAAFVREVATLSDRFGFDASKPVLIRNFGYQSLAIEADTVDNEGAGNLPGYLAKSGGGSGAGAYANGKYTAAGFDQGREVGFTGLNVNANLALQGTVKIFSCDTNHPRC